MVFQDTLNVPAIPSNLLELYIFNRHYYTIGSTSFTQEAISNMTVHFVPGTLYMIDPSYETHMYIDDDTQIDLRTTVILCLSKYPHNRDPLLEMFLFLCTDASGTPHEFTMCEGSVYGELCKEVST